MFFNSTNTRVFFIEMCAIDAKVNEALPNSGYTNVYFTTSDPPKMLLSIFGIYIVPTFSNMFFVKYFMKNTTNFSNQFSNFLENFYYFYGPLQKWPFSLREKCLNTEFFLVRIFPHSDWIRRDTQYLSVLSPNAGKYGPENTPYLGTFHAVFCLLSISKLKVHEIFNFCSI